MVSKPESKLWYQLKEATKKQVYWTRIESWALPGVPDVHGILEGFPFWIELKVHRLKSLNSIALSPHQINWQTQYIRNKGIVWNLVAHPSSSTLNLFWGGKAFEMTDKNRKTKTEPDWSCPNGSKAEWEKMISFIQEFRS